MRNTGKSSLGKKAAEVLKKDFYDMDEELIKKYGSLESLQVDGKSFEEKMVKFREKALSVPKTTGIFSRNRRLRTNL